MKQTITRYQLEILELLIDARLKIADATKRLLLVDGTADLSKLGVMSSMYANGTPLAEVCRRAGITIDDPLVDERMQGGD
jgi:hypothetical protein